MPNLAPVDLMVMLIYFFFTIAIGVGLKQFMVSGATFLMANRALPAWLCGLAIAGTGLGSLEVLSMGAAGARYGLVSAAFFGLGSVVPLVFAAVVLVPAYYASRAKSLPGYLGLRFDEKTRVLGAVWMAIGLLLTAALTLFVMARVSAGLRLYDAMFHLQTIGSRGQLGLAVVVPAGIALSYLALGGLGATMYAQVMQFFVLVAGFLPMVLLGLKQVGGWGGMKTAFGTAVAGQGVAASGATSIVYAVLLGILLTAGAACTDQGLLQGALAAESGRAARKASLIAGVVKALMPFLLILPGVIAVTVPSPRTSITIRNVNGEIFHEINVVPHAVEEGLGLVPAKTDSIADPQSGNVIRDARGKVVINYEMATPGLLPHNLPTGLLGLGLAALLACLTGAVATRISAFNSVLVYDLIVPHVRKEASEKYLVGVSRLASVAGVGVACLLAWGAMRVHTMPDVMDIVAVLLAVVFTPMLGTFLLGATWKRATGTGAFAGLLLGLIAALVHWGISLPPGYARGFAGGWLGAAHHPASMLVQNAGTAVLALMVNLAVTVLVSFATAGQAEAVQAGLVFTLSPSKEKLWWKRPRGIAALIILLAIVVTVIFSY